VTENGGQHTTNRNFCLFLFVFPYCCFSSLSPGYSICCVVLDVCLFRERLRRFGRCRPSSSVLGACQCLDFYFFSLSPHIQHTAEEEEEEKVMDNETRAPLVFLYYTSLYRSHPPFSLPVDGERNSRQHPLPPPPFFSLFRLPSHCSPILITFL
jgi:hypothetical protein